MEQTFAGVVGAGVVGLAVAARLANSGKEVLVLEEAASFGEGVSSRNSEVIHAGIYYPAGSLKASLCVAGKALLYRYCADRHIPHSQCGKLIVATSAEEEGQLADIQARGTANGVDDLKYRDQAFLNQVEPALRAQAALFSPSTGIIDSHQLMQALIADIERGGGQVVTHCKVTGVRHEKGQFVVTNLIDSSNFELGAQIFVNAAGLGAQAVARACEFVPAELIPPLHYAKGVYFTYPGAAPFQHLIYPVPERSGAGLGIHATLDLAGQVRFGPDVEYTPELDYSVPETPGKSYLAAIQRYFPGLDPGRLQPAYAGIRPKLQRPGEPPEDFEIQGPAITGQAGLVQLFGIESPGLTSALAIAEEVEARLST